MMTGLPARREAGSPDRARSAYPGFTDILLPGPRSAAHTMIIQ
jgi:hypothetical protein